MLDKKGFKSAHFNVCSLRYKVNDILNLIQNYNLHVLALSETHLDSTIYSPALGIDGYNIYRLDRNLHGGGVASYVKKQIPVKVRNDLYIEGIEVIWLQLQLTQLKPLLIGCSYRPPNATIMDSILTKCVNYWIGHAIKKMKFIF